MRRDEAELLFSPEALLYEDLYLLPISLSKSSFFLTPSAVVGVLGHTPLFPETGRKTNGACAFSCFWSLARGSRLGCPLEQQLDAPGTPWGQSTC